MMCSKHVSTDYRLNRLFSMLYQIQNELGIQYISIRQPVNGLITMVEVVYVNPEKTPKSISLG